MGHSSDKVLEEIVDADCCIEEGHYAVLLNAFFGGGPIRKQLLRITRGISQESFIKLQRAVMKNPPRSEEELRTVFIKNLFFMHNSKDTRYTRERACYMLLSLEEWRSNGHK